MPSRVGCCPLEDQGSSARQEGSSCWLGHLPGLTCPALLSSDLPWLVLAIRGLGQALSWQRRSGGSLSLRVLGGTGVWLMGGWKLQVGEGQKLGPGEIFRPAGRLAQCQGGVQVSQTARRHLRLGTDVLSSRAGARIFMAFGSSCPWTELGVTHLWRLCWGCFYMVPKKPVAAGTRRRPPFFSGSGGGERLLSGK